MGSLNLWVCLLTVAFAAKNVSAIKCHQCIDCSDGNEQGVNATECTNVTLGSAFAALITKSMGSDGEQVANMTKTMFDQLGTTPESCFKMAASGVTMRGCSPKTQENTCADENDVTICVCADHDGCNGATIT